MSDSSSTTESHGPGPFITHRVQAQPHGGVLVAISRLHRKGHPARVASLLLSDMKAAIEYFAKHPIQSVLTSEEASGFHH